MNKRINLLEEQKIAIEDLLLDPNNPRFSKHIEDRTPEDKVADAKEQEYAYAQMNDPKNNFQIEELVDAILEDGFIHVDKIFVKKIGGKYLVIEGNRRVTSIKRILKEKAGSIDNDLKNQITSIPCIIVDGSDKNADDTIRKILGLRHHGSILPWKPLPAAFSLYQEYMLALNNGDTEKAKDPLNFSYNRAIAKKVASMFSVKLSEVRSKVKLYRVYIQLVEASRQNAKVIGSDSFSFIEESLNKKALKDFFGYDENLSVFSDEGVELMLDIYFGLDGKAPVITQASAGNSTVRDFAYVVAEGTSEDVDRIIKDRETSQLVKSDVVTKRSQRSLQNSLETIQNELDKINLGEIGDDGLAPNEKESIKKIQTKLDKIKRVGKIK